VVYGGGGIVPDVFVPLDSTLFSGTLAGLNYLGLIREYTFDYIDTHRKMLMSYADEDDFIKRFSVTPAMLNELADKANARDKSITRAEVSKISTEVSMRIKAQIARTLFSENAMTKVFATGDAEFIKALEIARDYRKFAVIPTSAVK
jgi:carboxyl-terminal processing protease